MRIGIVSEGRADQAVIMNIVKGITGLDDSDIKPILPIRALDETDKARIKDKTEFGGFSAIKKELETGTLVEEFLAIDGQEFVIIHLDTAECHAYDVQRPEKKATQYAEKVRSLVIDKINTWLGNINKDQIIYAIAVEETDAWLLPLFEKKDSTTGYKAKEKLAGLLAKKDLDATSNYENFLILSKPFLKKKHIEKGKFLEYNISLKAFFEEVENKVLPKLKN